MAIAATWALTRWRKALLALLESAGTVDVESAPRQAQLASFDRAIAHFASGEWARAFDELSLLADAGHREGARIALLMGERGPRLFGRSFVIDAERRRRWREAARLTPPSRPTA